LTCIRKLTQPNTQRSREEMEYDNPKSGLLLQEYNKPTTTNQQQQNHKPQYATTHLMNPIETRRTKERRRIINNQIKILDLLNHLTQQNTFSRNNCEPGSLSNIVMSPKGGGGRITNNYTTSHNNITTTQLCNGKKERRRVKKRRLLHLQQEGDDNHNIDPLSNREKIQGMINQGEGANTQHTKNNKFGDTKTTTCPSTQRKPECGTIT